MAEDAVQQSGEVPDGHRGKVRPERGDHKPDGNSEVPADKEAAGGTQERHQ